MQEGDRGESDSREGGKNKGTGYEISRCDRRKDVGTNNADRDGTTRIVKRYRELVETLKKTRVEQIILSGILPVVRGRGVMYSNCKRMAINALLEQTCEEEGVGFVDLWGYFVGREDMYMTDGLHLSGKGAAVFSENLLRSMDNGTGCNFLN